MNNDLCHHRTTALAFCTLYAFILATTFVLNLYLLIPTSISKLPRSDPRQIKWRISSVVVTFVTALATYPFLFCQDFDINTINSTSINDEQHQHQHHYSILVFRDVLMNILGWRPLDPSTFIPLMHVMVLYLGSFITSILQHRLRFILQHRLSFERQKLIFDKNVRTNDSFLVSICRRILQSLKEPFHHPWQATRDLVIGPLAEEIIFRSCIISPFLHSTAHQSGNLSIQTISYIAPLFFGLAHVHHAFLKLKQGIPLKQVVIGTVFQLTYTTLFGAYVSYCFIKICSLPGIVFVHSFCNFMGLPNVGLLLSGGGGAGCGRIGNGDDVKWYRVVSGVAYLIGIAMFWIGFRTSMGLFPEQGFLLAE